MLATVSKTSARAAHESRNNVYLFRNASDCVSHANQSTLMQQICSRQHLSLSLPEWKKCPEKHFKFHFCTQERLNAIQTKEEQMLAARFRACKKLGRRPTAQRPTLGRNETLLSNRNRISSNGENVVLHPSQYLSIYLVLCNAPEARLIQSDLARLMHS